MIARRRLLAGAVAGVVLAGVLIVACGKDDEEKAGEAAVAVYHEIGNDDAGAFCELLSDPVRDQLAKMKIGYYAEEHETHTCEAKFERFENAFDPARVKDAEFANAEVDGDRATVALVFDEDQRLEGAPEAPKKVRLSMVKEGGDWKLAKLLIPEPPSTPGNYGGDEAAGEE